MRSYPLLTLLAIAIIVVGFTIPASIFYVNEEQDVLNSWLTTEPKMMVKLEIQLPGVAADVCAVIVRRFSTPYNPTEGGYTEHVYVGVHRPGELIGVKNTLFAAIVKMECSERGCSVGYYEPQEYFVAVMCRKGNETSLEWNKIVEVYPRTVVHAERVVVPASGPQTLMGSTYPTYVSESPDITCNITITEEQRGSNGYVKRGYCMTWVRGPYIYSLNGVSTSFRLKVEKPLSAVYIEGFSDADVSNIRPPPRREDQVLWKSAGKKLVPTLAGASTQSLAGNYRDKVYFWVSYKYEYGETCYLWCYQWWLLYPNYIGSVVRSEQIPSLPYEKSPYSPPQSPPYKSPLLPGTTTIRFGVNGTYESGVSLASITIAYTYSGVWTASLTVNFYKAGRSDSEYDTPFLDVQSDVLAYWWFEDNDPMTYEVLFSIH